LFWKLASGAGRRTQIYRLGVLVSDGGFHFYPDSARTPRGGTYHVFLQREGVLVAQAERAVQAKAEPEHPSLLLHDRKSVPADVFAINEDRGSLWIIDTVGPGGIDVGKTRHKHKSEAAACRQHGLILAHTQKLIVCQQQPRLDVLDRYICF